MSTKSVRVIAALTLIIAFTLAIGSVGCSKGSGEFKPGGNVMDEMRDAINQEVPDTDRAAKMLAIIDQIEADLGGLDQALRAFYRDYTALDMDYNTTREQFEDLFASFRDTRITYRDGFVDAHFELKNLATREEWKKISDVDETIYRNWRRSYDLSSSAQWEDDA